jgi:phosphatidylglycerol:prolipoprotein diacylglycerol transferase
MKPELFHVGGLTVFGYGFCILIGVIAAYLHFYFNRKRIGITEDQISTLILVCGISVFVGGKLFFILEDPVTYLSDPSKWMSNLGDGFVF